MSSAGDICFTCSREFSVRAILDYNGVLPNTSLILLDRDKRLAADILATY